MVSQFKGRREDVRLVTGRGRYSDDWGLPGQLYASFKRSERAHALVRSVEVDTAQRVSGVVAILTGRDIAALGFRTLMPIAPLLGRDGKKIVIPKDDSGHRRIHRKGSMLYNLIDIGDDPTGSIPSIQPVNSQWDVES